MSDVEIQSEENLIEDGAENVDEINAAEEVLEASQELESDEVTEAEMQADAELIDSAERAEDLVLEAQNEDGESEPEEVEFIEDELVQSILESILFSADRPMGLKAISDVFKGTNIKKDRVKRSLELLSIEYAGANRGITLEEVTGGYQLRTKIDNMKFLRRSVKARPFRLSGPAMEVLSIICYKQPVVKAEVDEIRGVDSSHLVRALMDRGLVSFAGKSELPGRPMQYATTRKFLEIFGLRSLNELPSLSEIDEILPEGIDEEIDKENLSDITTRLSEEVESTYSQGEEELLQITEKLSEINSSSEFFEEEKRRQREARDNARARDIREAMDVGEEVSENDVKWLSRYEARLAEEAAQSEVQESSENGETSESLEMSDADAIDMDDTAIAGGPIESAEEILSTEIPVEEGQEVASDSDIEAMEAELAEEAPSMTADEFAEAEVVAAIREFESDDESDGGAISH